MPRFLVTVVQLVDAEDGDQALDLAVEAYVLLKAPDTTAYAVAAPEDSDWARKTYKLFKENHDGTSRTS